MTSETEFGGLFVDFSPNSELCSTETAAEFYLSTLTPSTSFKMAEGSSLICYCTWEMSWVLDSSFRGFYKDSCERI